MPNIIWEPLSDGITYRAKVIGGWLIRIDSNIELETVVNVSINTEQTNNIATSPINILHAVTFLPDPEYMWDNLEKINTLLTNGNSNG